MTVFRLTSCTLQLVRNLSTCVQSKTRPLAGLAATPGWQTQCQGCNVSVTPTGSTLYSCPSQKLGAPLIGLQSVRFYNHKKTIKIPPTKPLNFDNSGDMVTVMPDFDKNGPLFGFDDIPELQSASKEVKQLFSLEFADGQEQLKRQVEDIRMKVQEHPADLKSLEVRIAVLTIMVRNQMKHVKTFRKDKAAKSYLIERINARNLFLRILRSQDTEKFQWLLEELKIKYIPLRSALEKRKLSKRALRKKVARDSMLQDKKDKLQELRMRLEAERAAFEEEKECELAAIEKELPSLGIQEMSSLDSTLQQLGMEHLIEKPEPRIKRRYLILRKKFELHAQKVKQASALQNDTK